MMRPSSKAALKMNQRMMHRVTVELFCETCMGEEVVSYDSEQIFKDQFEGQPVDWKGLLKSLDPLSYDRYFRAENGFLATLEIYRNKRPL